MTTLTNDHPAYTVIRPYFVWRTVFFVCAVPDRRPSLKRDHLPGQMGFLSLVDDHFECSVFPRIAGGASTSVRTVPNCGLLVLQCCAQTPLKQFNCFEPSFILPTLQLRSGWTLHRYNVNCQPVGAQTPKVVVIQVLWTSRIRGAVIINDNATQRFM